MNARLLIKILLLEFWFLFAYPILASILLVVLGRNSGPDAVQIGIFVSQFFFVIWCWGIFAYSHYRFCRQEEFLYLLRTAANTQAPLEGILSAYLEDRPTEHFYRAILLSFVFPGYYFIHLQRSFDSRLNRLATMLSNGMPLDRALMRVPGVVSREVALAATVGQFSGRLPLALQRMTERRLAPMWLELLPRLGYPLLVLFAMVNILSFVMVFIIPKFERIFSDFKLKLPLFTEVVIGASRWFSKYWYVMALCMLLFAVLVHVIAFSSYLRWNLPPISWVYRLYARGQFLQMLGFMMESGKPMPVILDCALESGLLPGAVASRVNRLAADLDQGQPLVASLTRTGLMTPSMLPLVMVAEKAQNLPWALQELGDSLVRRSARLCYSFTMICFPLAVFACACLIGFIAVAMFQPLVELIEGVSVMK